MQKTKKCVVVLDASLPVGELANTAVILGITLGKYLPEIVGEDVYDADGKRHAGIIKFPVPVLRAEHEQLAVLRRQAAGYGADVVAVDFSTLAQGCETYEEYIHAMGETGSDALGYIGLALYGEKKRVNRLTGSLPLLR